MASITHHEYIFTLWLTPALSVGLTSPQSFSRQSVFLPLSHTHTCMFHFTSTYIKTDRTQAEWNHPHMQPADTYMRSHCDTISYTPWIYTRILLKPWQPHPPSTSLQSIQWVCVCVCARACMCVCETDAIYTITLSGFELVALVTELNSQIWVTFVCHKGRDIFQR